MMLTVAPLPRCHLALLAALLLGLTACSPRSGPFSPDDPIPAQSGPYTVQLVALDGPPLPTYRPGIETWVEGTLGQRYGVQVQNPTARRIEVVVTVDGRDAISGQPGSFDARGYIVEPHGSVLIDGFRTSMHAVAAFRFTTPGDSYAGRMGGGANVGVIGVAIFAEDGRPPYMMVPERERAADRAAPAAPTAARGMGMAESQALAGDDIATESPGLGTQYGERQSSPAVEVPFRRTSDRPEAVMAVYYDDRAGLVRRGIIQHPAPSPIRPTPFPQNAPRFAPPPR